MRMSIVIPTHNRRDLLRQCLAAATQQDYPDYEVIVVDDGSTDGTREMVRQDFPKVRYVRQEPNRGPAAARNRGIEAAAGEIIAFTDDDCAPPANWLSLLAEGLARYPDAGAVGGLQEPPPDTRRESLLARYEYAVTRRWYGLGDRPVRGRPAPGATNNLAVPRALLERVGGFDESFPVPAGEDADLLRRLAVAGYETVNLPIRVAHHGAYTWRGFCHQQVQRGVGSVVFQRKWGGLHGHAYEVARLVLLPLIIIRDLGRLKAPGLLLPLAVARYAQAFGRCCALSWRR